MQQQVIRWLKEAGLQHYTDTAALLIVLAAIILISVLTHLILHHALLPQLRRHAEQSRHRWPKAMIHNRLFSRFVWLMQGVLFKLQTELFCTTPSRSTRY